MTTTAVARSCAGFDGLLPGAFALASVTANLLHKFIEIERGGLLGWFALGTVLLVLLVLLLVGGHLFLIILHVLVKPLLHCVLSLLITDLEVDAPVLVGLFGRADIVSIPRIATLQELLIC